MPIALLPIILTIISSLFVLVNFIAYLAKGRILTRPKIWHGIQGWVVVILPILFGQKPDSLIRAFTDTYQHGFSQLDHLCENVQCGGHFLCSVGANGHPKIVKPIRYGERNGRKIICTRQLLISNAFEELVQEKCPLVHKMIRHNYNKVGRLIHRYYGIFNNKYISDLVYICMKPLELLFLLILYTFDKKPENRIAKQYLAKSDLEAINGGHWLPIPDNSRGAI